MYETISYVFNYVVGTLLSTDTKPQSIIFKYVEEKRFPHIPRQKNFCRFPFTDPPSSEFVCSRCPCAFQPRAKRFFRSQNLNVGAHFTLNIEHIALMHLNKNPTVLSQFRHMCFFGVNSPLLRLTDYNVRSYMIYLLHTVATLPHAETLSNIPARR